jgi:hypothetical protein
MNFSFEEAEVSTGSSYLEPGNHLVTITEVKKGESSQSKSTFIEVTVKDGDGSSCSHQYYLSTDVGEGKQRSAWSYTASSLLTLAMAANGYDEKTAKSNLTGINQDNIANKLSSILVGKRIAINLMGTWVNPTDTSKSPWVKTSFGSFLFAVPVDQIGKLSKKIYIKGEPNKSTSEVGPEKFGPNDDPFA